MPSAPETLYVRGRLVADDALAVAMVGSRRATPYGLEVAERLGADLAARGVTVVSGLARGIDSAAHKGALASGGRTIAVLGSGVDVIYPPENRRLARRIAQAAPSSRSSLPGTPPLPYRFPERNRVIAGLALAVVVVEATERSGALITAGFAAELGREVLAVPGRVTSPESRGSASAHPGWRGARPGGRGRDRGAPDAVAACVKAVGERGRVAAPGPAPVERERQRPRARRAGRRADDDR